MTEHHTYIVRASGQGWSVFLNDTNLGTFLGGRHEAIQAAVMVAEASGRAGKTAEVLTDDGSELHPLWEVGRDTYSDIP